MRWPIDPDKKSPSVSLALVMVSTLCVLVGIGFNYAGKEVSTDLVYDFWSGCAMLYFGRKIPWDKFMSNKKGRKNVQQSEE
jgi:hypothetical protein